MPLPICPHCGQEIGTAKEVKLGADKIFYVCPKCNKILSVGNE